MAVRSISAILFMRCFGLLKKRACTREQAREHRSFFQISFSFFFSFFPSNDTYFTVIFIITQLATY
ncbi:Uncharacterized protein dnm_077370 [Desulfonema magnum]|uniref:Uncharacterized protein n=1 Tax=Desulfonema magnum TaxID=45655 RepID=A0A975GS48_9BACT|nr:Uncharacterized protein dnm_077370 [Desulfonema magnum]